MNPNHHINFATSSCIMNPNVSKFIESSRSTSRWQQRRRRVQPSQRLGYFSSLWLSFSLFLDFSCHCWIRILGFLLGLLGLLLFGFVEVFVLFFWNFVAGCTECLGFLLNFLGDGFFAGTLYVCVI